MEYNIVFDCDYAYIYNYYLQNRNESQKEAASTICYVFFGTSIKATRTLNNMADDFTAILQNISNQSSMIDQILQSPSVKLRNGDSHINCTEEEFTVLEVTIDLLIKSRYFDTDTIYTKLFDNPSGLFLKRAEVIFTDYFDTPVCINNESQLNTSPTTSWIKVAGIGILSCCVTIIAACICNKYRQKKRKLSYTIYW